ncbi:MAG: undecaprenyl/decaprenyl-phosphate alpha-N-acetylglucosaminyl 1-phosphate transferase [candidate division Zixibacteria bacterium]|nr:undecaprenyl/decaprenyl-phosphate alpha-N-acetylglucosaminyl 1-phosphate transferase [candidate division Zixibacteria bacterium]
MHKKAVPRIGGLAMYVSFLIAEIVGFSIYHNLLSELATELIGINLSLAVLVAGGIIDDIKQLKPGQKLFFQLAAAAITVAFGYQVRLLTIPFWGTVGLGSWGIPITMIWIVGLINAMNFLDGMDGLAAGVGFIISATFFASGLIFETEFPVIVACGLMGITAGFLKFNYPPASIFMGDSGSMMLGYLFAVISVIWPKSIATITMIVPIAALGVPLIESSITIIRRIFMRQSIYKADSLHIFHILRFLGLSETAILWLFYLISMLFSFVVIAILMPDRGLITALAAIFILIVFILLLKSSRKLY